MPSLITMQDVATNFLNLISNEKMLFNSYAIIINTHMALAGHLTFQCRNFLSIPEPEEKSDREEVPVSHEKADKSRKRKRSDSSSSDSDSDSSRDEKRKSKKRKEKRHKDKKHKKHKKRRKDKRD